MNTNNTPDLQALIELSDDDIERGCIAAVEASGFGVKHWPHTYPDADQLRKVVRAVLNTRQTAPTLPGAGGGDALDGMFSGLQSDLAKLTIGARLIGNFENMDWNQQRESLEGRVITAASALMAHTEAAGMTLDKDGISIRIAPIAYEGELS